MALIRWEPAAELNTIQNEMNRLFNTFFDQPSQTGRGNGTMRRWLPPMDLVETADQYVLRADLPGLSDGDVNVQLEDSVLTISGERKAEHEQQQEGYYRLERAFGVAVRAPQRTFGKGHVAASRVGTAIQGATRPPTHAPPGQARVRTRPTRREASDP